VQFAIWDRMFVKPQLPLRVVGEEGEVTLLLYHAYPSSLHNLRLSSPHPAFEMTADPPVVKEFEPTVFLNVTLHFRRRALVAGDTVVVPIEFSAEEMARSQAFDLTLPLTPQGEREVNEALSIPVGQVEVRVARFGEEVYYFYLVPMGLLLAWLLWRRTRFGG